MQGSRLCQARGGSQLCPLLPLTSALMGARSLLETLGYLSLSLT